jgi:hypothetical protein
VIERRTFHHVGVVALPPPACPLVGEVQVRRVVMFGAFPVEFPTVIRPVVEGDHHVSVEERGCLTPAACFQRAAQIR